MIEELCEYLVRQGWSQDIADDAHDAYLGRGIEGAVQSISWATDAEHDYRDELLDDVTQWQREVGEA